MPIIHWTDDLSVGIESIDTDHKLLIGLLNELDDAVRAGKGQETVTSVLNALLDYTNYHFGREEALMEACGYPDYDAHLQTHETLKVQVVGIRDRYMHNPDSIRDREVLAFLKNWLTAHIMGRDKLYAPFLASKPEEAAAAERAYQEALERSGVPLPAGVAGSSSSAA